MASYHSILHADISPLRRNKPTLVLIHGVAGSLHIWDPVYASLTRDYRVVRMDLLGYGHSPKPHREYTPAVHAHEIRTMLRAHKLVPPYTLVGLSMGSTVALEYAALYPEDVTSVVALGLPYYHTARQARDGLQTNTWARLSINHPKVAAAAIPPIWWLGKVGVLPAHLFAGIYSQLQARETLLSPYYVFRSNIHSMITVRPDPLLAGSSAIPRLFVHGENDTWAPPYKVRQAVAKYFKSQFVEVPNTGHNLVVLEPRLTVNLIREFLER